MGREPVKSQIHPLINGLAGNLQTVAFMKKIAREKAGDPRIQRFARLIVLRAGVPSHAYADEALAIGEFVQAHMRYSRDPDGIEQLQDPCLMMDDIEEGIAQGDCDDMALMIVTLLLAIGHNPFFRVVRYSDQAQSYEHIYVVDYEGNQSEKVQRIVLDAIVKDQPMGYELPHTSGDEIAV